MNVIKLIIGLANPGAQYSMTRHNAGAWYIDSLLQYYSQTLKSESQFYGNTGRISIAGQDVRLLIPNTFMNLSGKAVAAMASFYRIYPEEILVAHDELDLPPGVIKFKQNGVHAGHNGLKDIINKLGNKNTFFRLRIGIGHPGDRQQVTGFVLGRPSTQEYQSIIVAIQEAVACTELWFKEGRIIATNRLHSFRLQADNI